MKIEFLRKLKLSLLGMMLLQISIVHAEDLSWMKLPVPPLCTVQHREETYMRICSELLDRREIEEVRTMNFAGVATYKPIENGLILAAKLKKNDIGFYDRPAFSGEISTFLEPIDSDLFAIKIKFNGIERAKLNLILFNLAGRDPITLNIDGREPSERTVVEAWDVVLKKMQINGAKYEVLNFPAKKYLESKDVIVFRGRNCLTSIASCKIIYNSDGNQLQSFIANAYAANIGFDDLVLIGIPSSNKNRIGELLKGRDQDSFGAFLDFVVNDLRQAIENGDVPKSRYVAGYSNGGAWAFDALLFHPEIFDGAIVMSPATWELQSSVTLKQKSIVMGAGELEQGFFKTAQRMATIARDLGADVKMVYSKSGHSMNTWVPIWNMALKSLQ